MALNWVTRNKTVVATSEEIIQPPSNSSRYSFHLAGTLVFAYSPNLARTIHVVRKRLVVPSTNIRFHMLGGMNVMFVLRVNKMSYIVKCGVWVDTQARQ